MSDDSREGGGLTRFAAGASAAGTDRIVCHVDVDCFYAACERLREPALRGEPVVVGMGYEPGESHGAVATASYEAREFGVESAMGIGEALDRLPRKVDAAADPDLDIVEAGFYRPVDLDYYREVAADVKAILHDHADVVREVSIDEAYLDVTDRVAWDGTGDTPRRFASDLKERIRSAVGVVASVGVAPTMSAAKIASDYDKPDGLVVVEPGGVREFLAPLDVAEIHNVGPVTAADLRGMGIGTAGDLASADPERLRERFGERGAEIRRFARGDDDREVEPVGRPKSLSRESAFTGATADSDRKRERVRSLAADVAERAEREGALYRTIGIKVVTPPFDVNTRAESLPGPVQDADLVESTALELLGEFDDDRVRKLGVRVSNFSFAEGNQANLSGFDPEGSGQADDTGSGPPTSDTDSGRPTDNTGLGRWTGKPEADRSRDNVEADRPEDGDVKPAGEDAADTGFEEGQRSLSEFE